MPDKSQRILDAAFDNFRQFGFLKTTVDEIAKQAQVGKGTIYSYFANKEQILVALVDREFRKGFSIISEAISQEKNAIAKLKQLLKTTFDYFHTNALISKVLAMDRGVALTVISEKNKEIQRISIAGIKIVLEQGQKEGVLRKVDNDKVAYTIDGMIRSFHYMDYLGLQLYHPREMVDAVLDLLILGLAK